MFLREASWGSQEEVRGVREDWEREEERVSREESRVNRGTSSHAVILMGSVFEIFTRRCLSLVRTPEMLSWRLVEGCQNTGTLEASDGGCLALGGRAGLHGVMHSTQYTRTVTVHHYRGSS